MLVPMTKARILGSRPAAAAVLGELQRLGLAELTDARAAHAMAGLDGAGTRSARSEELDIVLAQTDKLLDELTGEPRSRVRPTRSADRWISPSCEPSSGASPSASRWSAGVWTRCETSAWSFPPISSRSGCYCPSCPFLPTLTSTSSA